MFALIPLLVTLITCVGAALYALKRKSLAQTTCVQQATRLQRDLKKPLQKLIKLNRRASTLRNQREMADKSLDVAISSGVPYAIAAAKAVQTAVILGQLELQAEQLLLLADAQRIRSQSQIEMHLKAGRLLATQLQTPTYYHRALAVEAKPIESLSPNYEMIPFFEWGQQQRFRFTIDVLEDFPLNKLGLEVKQKTECSVTLQPKDDDWDLQILAAKAS